MGKTSRPLLVMFIGFPGSGKTHFAKQLGEQLNAVVLNSDALRVAMFGTLERIEKIRKSDNTRLYDDVFSAINYSTRQALKAGVSVVYDAQQRTRLDRMRLEKLAADCNSRAVLVWIQTDPTVAMQRGQDRLAGDDSHVYDEEKMKYLVSRFDKVTDKPKSDEPVIMINGEEPFEEQYKSFTSKLSQLY